MVRRICVCSLQKLAPHAPKRAAGGPAAGEEGEKLGFVTAVGASLTAVLRARSTALVSPLAACRSGGLVAASAGAIAVFGLGVLGVMGAAKGAASLLGALTQRTPSSLRS